MALRIVKSLFPLSLQDGGRRGYRALGVPLSGPMDADAHRLANLLCGNESGSTALELTLHGAVLMVERELCLAHVGGGSQLHINGEPVPSGRLIRVRAFSLLEFRVSARGCRSYLAICGGIASSCDLGSGSLYEPAHLGGLEGRALRHGDLLLPADPEKSSSSAICDGIELGVSGWRASRWGIPSDVASPAAPTTLRVLPGPEWEEFPTVVQDIFLTSTYRLTAASGRMGYRLEGPSLERRAVGEMLSTAVCPGTVQVPHDGKPILLMSDAQTVGGYPRIAQVFSADLPGCGQLRPGDSVRFALGSMAEAEQAFHFRDRRFRDLSRAIYIRHHG
jgi:antagonist of KipI